MAASLELAVAVLARLIETTGRIQDESKTRMVFDSLPRLVPKSPQTTPVVDGLREVLRPLFREGGIAPSDRTAVLRILLGEIEFALARIPLPERRPSTDARR